MGETLLLQTVRFKRIITHHSLDRLTSNVQTNIDWDLQSINQLFQKTNNSVFPYVVNGRFKVQEFANHLLLETFKGPIQFCAEG